MHICVAFKYSYISYKNNFNFLRICVAKENLKKKAIQSHSIKNKYISKQIKTSNACATDSPF